MLEIRFLLLLFATSIIYSTDATEIRIENEADYEILDCFFKMGCEDEEYGYVLEGEKPISIRHFYPMDRFPLFKNIEHGRQEFAKTLLVQKAVSVWNRICKNQKRIVLKAIFPKSSKSTSSELEIALINVPVLKKTIASNIDLFRYVLGSSITAEELSDRIAWSSEPLSSLLQNNRILEGIVLGFGSHNSVIGGRMETIYANILSKDCPPFLPKSRLMLSKENPMAPEAFGYYFLEYAGGENAFFRENPPAFSFDPLSSNPMEEILAMNAMEESIPDSLYEAPAFIFGAFNGGSSNKLLFDRLLKAQRETQNLLKDPKFLEKILTKIGGKKAVISCKNRNTTVSAFCNKMTAEEWVQILEKTMGQFETKESQAAFIKAFCNPPPTPPIAPKIARASPAMLRGLQKALSNLAIADNYFDHLFKKDAVIEIMPNQLYIKTTRQGSGKKLEKSDLVRLSYVIEDLGGNILFANHDHWLPLSQTIPGIAYGVKDMSIGEKRTLFVHPALGYGALTTLPPCAALIIKVELLDFDATISTINSSLSSIDLNWIQNPELYKDIQESIKQKPHFLGFFYRQLLDEMLASGKKEVIAKFEDKYCLIREETTK
jgi:hypothetical protein